MPDFVLDAPLAAAPEELTLIYEVVQGPEKLLRPVARGEAYYALALVERALPPAFAADPPVAREWESLGQVYLLADTLQTLRWTPEIGPGAYHVGRVPAAEAYRLSGEAHEYTLAELVETLKLGLVAFWGYPYFVGAEHRLQFTPPEAGATSAAGQTWASAQRRVLVGSGAQRGGVHYQLYEEVDEQGLSTGSCYTGQRTESGEWLTHHSPVDLAAVDGDWLRLLPGA